MKIQTKAHRKVETSSKRVKAIKKPPKKMKATARKKSIIEKKRSPKPAVKKAIKTSVKKKAVGGTRKTASPKKLKSKPLKAKKAVKKSVKKAIKRIIKKMIVSKPVSANKKEKSVTKKVAVAAQKSPQSISIVGGKSVKPQLVKIQKQIKEKMEKKVGKKPRTMVTTTTIAPLNLPPFKEEQGEEYMSKRQLGYFQNILDTWRDQLHAERNATVQHMQEDPINFPDLLDRAALEEEHKIEWQAREREHRLIIKIEKALARIKQGDYGYCEKCGSEIGSLRLQVRPTATLCVDCKAIDEIRERQTGVVE